MAAELLEDPAPVGCAILPAWKYLWHQLLDLQILVLKERKLGLIVSKYHKNSHFELNVCFIWKYPFFFSFGNNLLLEVFHVSLVIFSNNTSYVIRIQWFALNQFLSVGNHSLH